MDQVPVVGVFGPPPKGSSSSYPHSYQIEQKELLQVLCLYLQENKPSFVVSGLGTFSGLCWVGAGLKYVKTSGDGRNGSAWETLCTAVEVNCHLNIGLPES